MSIWLTAILAGLSIGIVGNLHCIAMCGPLALSLPMHHFNAAQKTQAIIFYNFGRVFSYTLLGIFFGIIGKSFSLFGWQQALSIACGIILLLLVFSNVLNNNHISFLQKPKLYVQQMLSNFIAKNNKPYTFGVIGFFNGLLPCGLVYIAIATATAMGGVMQSAVVMFAFGVGTFPLMISLLLFKNSIPLWVVQKGKKLIPVFVTLMACLLILRGLNLGIKYISPTNSTPSKSVECHG